MGYLNRKDYLRNKDQSLDIGPHEALETNREFLAHYWSHQYERLTRVEEQRLQFTNIVVAASVVAIAILVERSDAVSAVLLAGAFLGVIGTNLLAIGYLLRMRQHAQQILVRARLALNTLAPELVRLNMETAAPTNRFHSVVSYQIALHFLLAVIALAGLTVG